MAIVIVGIAAGWLLFAPNSPMNAPVEESQSEESSSSSSVISEPLTPPPVQQSSSESQQSSVKPEPDVPSSSSVSSESVAAKNCVISGCSSQVCGEEEVTTTCEWKAEYGCYQSATCEVQTNGECGWTMDSALQTCLNDAQKDERCLQQPDPGMCKAAIERFFFSGETCQSFIWGGCGGSVPFETLAECQQACE